jgi:purine-binding chemotaxis protein CheW
MDNTTRHIDASEYATFYLKDALCGIALSSIQEINQPSVLTMVPQSPDYVMGVINLRGKIVTVIDTAKRLGLSSIRQSHTMRNIIVNANDESVGLMVDRIGNVISVEPRQVDTPPANIGEVPGRCFDAVYKTDEQLVGLLSLKAFQ